MSPLAQGAIVLCVVVLSAVAVAALVALRRAALRAEGVLVLAEREIRPLVAQVEGLTGEVRQLSRSANDELRRASAVVQRADEVSTQVVRILGVVSGLGRVWQYVGIAVAVKKGAEAFVKTLKTKH